MSGTRPALLLLARARSGQVEALGLYSPVVAGLVPATSIILALSSNPRGGRDRPGDDADRVIQRRRNRRYLRYSSPEQKTGRGSV